MVAFPSFTPYIARTTPHNVHSQSHKNKNIELSKSIIFTTSGLGGCLGWLFVHPFNTLAVRYNLASMSNKKFSFQNMVHEKGWISLYDGLTAGLSRQLLYATSRFGLFEMMRDLLHEMRGGKTDFGTSLNRCCHDIISCSRSVAPCYQLSYKESISICYGKSEIKLYLVSFMPLIYNTIVFF